MEKTYPRERRPATAREAKALGHPLRLRILRLCRQQELTNKQLADRLGRDPGTVLYHVRQLADAGLLEQVPVRTGDSGALKSPTAPPPTPGGWKAHWPTPTPTPRSPPSPPSRTS